MGIINESAVGQSSKSSGGSRISQGKGTNSKKKMECEFYLAFFLKNYMKMKQIRSRRGRVPGAPIGSCHESKCNLKLSTKS